MQDWSERESCSISYACCAWYANQTPWSLSSSVFKTAVSCRDLFKARIERDTVIPHYKQEKEMVKLVSSSLAFMSRSCKWGILGLKLSICSRPGCASCDTLLQLRLPRKAPEALHLVPNPKPFVAPVTVLPIQAGRQAETTIENLSSNED